MAEIAYLKSTRRCNLSEAVPLDTPFTIVVDPTTRCNFRCAYCPHSLEKQACESRIGKMEDMSMETFRMIVEQLEEFPQMVKHLNLCGNGEPLLNKNLPEMIRLVKESCGGRGLAKRIVIYSNGSLLTHELSDALISAGLDDLRISLQGLSGKKYQEICGVEIDYDQFLNNLRYYFEHKKDGQQLSVKIIDVALNAGEEEKFYQTFNNISDRMTVEMCAPVKGIAFTERSRTETVDRQGISHPPRTVCPMPFYIMMTAPNGDVSPCCSGHPINLGNVHDRSLRDIFGGEQMRGFWKMQLRGERCHNPSCAGCSGPDDLAKPEDVLDDAAKDILARLEQ